MALRCLIVEDNELDTELIIRSLRRNGFTTRYGRVDTRRDLQHSLDSEEWDIVTTDNSMPCLSATETVEMVRARYPDLPVIVVSGSIDPRLHDLLIEKGASDYIEKSNLDRLPMCIARHVREKRQRKDQYWMIKELFKIERRHQYIYDECCITLTIDFEGRIDTVRGSEGGCPLGITLGGSIFDIISPETSRKIIKAMHACYNTRGAQYFEVEIPESPYRYGFLVDAVMDKGAMRGYCIHIYGTEMPLSD